MGNQFGLFLLENAVKKNRLETQNVRGISFVPNYYFKNVWALPKVDGAQNSRCLKPGRN